MIALDTQPTAVLMKLLEHFERQLDKNGFVILDEHGYLKDPEAGGIMPVYLEMVYDAVGNFCNREWTSPVRQFSVAHYKKLNGDLCAEPLMEFYIVDARNSERESSMPLGSLCKVFPCRYKMDLIGPTDTDLLWFEDGKWKYRKEAYHQSLEFVTEWMANIAKQQSRIL